MIEWFFAEVMAAIWLLGWNGASAASIPIGGLLLGAITLVSGRFDLDELFSGMWSPAGLVTARILAGLLLRSLALATLDFEFGTTLRWCEQHIELGLSALLIPTL